MKKILFAILLFLPTSVFALNDTYNNHAGCTYSDMSALKQEVALVDFSYDYDLEKFMIITTTNLQPEFYGRDQFGGKFIYDAKREIPSLQITENYIDDQTLYIEFYASSASTCDGEKISTITFKLPRYNEYYGDVACEGISPDAFALCSKWYPEKVSYTAFLNRVRLYKYNLENSDAPDDQVVEDDSFIDWLLANYRYILFGVLGVSIIGITIIEIRNRRKEF